MSQEGPLESLEVTTIDKFCEDNRVHKIDILKIDTEGHEKEVLLGGMKMLEKSRIGFIKLECGVDPGNSRHVPYAEVVNFLSDMGYRIFGVYDQENEFFRKEPQLRRFDLAFISKDKIKENKKYPGEGLRIYLIVLFA